MHYKINGNETKEVSALTGRKGRERKEARIDNERVQRKVLIGKESRRQFNSQGRGKNEEKTKR